ncbi:MAG: pyridoxal kinase PdxY [Acetobacteraceae bacterium]
MLPPAPIPSARPERLLAIASAVAYGHVGNSACVFPLQRLGAEVWPVATVRFSNHPGYGAFTGTVTPAAEVRALLDGIAARGVLGGCDGVLSGYLGDPATGPAVLDALDAVRAANPAALWACDPVIGDDGPGIYVRPGIAEFFRDQAPAAADVLTPNRFELSALTGRRVETLAEARAAAGALSARMRGSGPGVVLASSLPGEADTIAVLAASREGAWCVRTPRLPIAVNGTGDLLAGLFLLYLIRLRAAPAALGAAVSALHAVLRRTAALGERELALVAAQDALVAPGVVFTPEAV